MNYEFFIAKRIHFAKDKGDNKRVTPPVVRIAVAGIAIGLAVMIVSVAVVVGFKKEVRNKVIGFGAHIQLANFDSNTSYETTPIVVSDTLRETLYNTNGVRHIEAFATKPGMIKTENDFYGVVMKGVDADFNPTFFNRHLVDGQMIHIDSFKTDNQALISRSISNALHIYCGDSFLIYFVNKERDMRVRKMRVSGIYDTGFSDYDKLFVICDIKLIRRINGWDKDMASGVGVFIDNYDQIDQLTNDLYFSFINKKDRLGNTCYARSIKELNPMIFNWLSVLDSNVVILLALMALVSGFTMIAGLLIIILERANMIGILKALGENNYSVRKIFLYLSFFLITKGMIIGNLIGVALCLLQSYGHWLKLDPATYYLDSVPIELSPLSLVLINVGSLVVSMFMMIAPSYLISQIKPAKSIRFE